MKIDVAVQSYKKPESLIYTLLSLKKYCGDNIETIYINDDQSNDGTIDFYNENLKKALAPIRIEVRVNKKKSGYTTTCMTKDAFKHKSITEKFQLRMHKLIKRIQYFSTSDDLRYQWAINNTNKKYLFIIHDDIKFFNNVISIYLDQFKTDENLAIVGDLGGSKRCPFGPCGTKECNPKKIMEGYRPYQKWPLTGREKTFIHKLLGRKNRKCRINEWCCIIDVEKAKYIENKYGVFFGNYEGGGDVGTFWFEKIIKEGFGFCDPLPTKEERLKYYLHWWQGYEGHSVWVSGDSNLYEKNMIKEKLKEDFEYYM